MESIVLAADLGGTNVRVAAVRSDGKILTRESGSTPDSNNFEELVDKFVSLARSALANAGPAEGEPAVFGIALPGAIDTAAGVVIQSPNLPEMDQMPFAEKLGSRLGVPVILENDANAAAIGENWLGASRGAMNSICVTLGTGVGGGVIIDGKLLRGADGAAGELGHMSVIYDGEKCGCGSFGCIEQYASATAIVRMAKEFAAEFGGSMMRISDELTAADVYDAGVAGDAAALAVFRKMGECLGTSLAGLVNLLNPEIIVIGGGASAGWDLFIGHTRELIDKKAYRRSAERVKIVRAALGDDAGIIGAARTAFNFLSVGAAEPLSEN